MYLQHFGLKECPFRIASGARLFPESALLELADAIYTLTPSTSLSNAASVRPA